jgi:hypothetical protein
MGSDSAPPGTVRTLPVLRAYPDPMERRLAGVVLLLVALTVVVSVPRLLEPGLVARPAALPLPAPPAIGACLDLSVRVTQVSCAQPHAAEVTARWAADAAGRPSGDAESRCRAAAFSYVGLGLIGSAQVWRPSFGGRSWVVHAPAGERIGERGWSACVIGPSRAATSSGAVRDLGLRPTGRPAEFGVCVSTDEIMVACDRPHRVEYLTDAVGFARSLVNEREASRWRTGCAEIAAVLLATPDPTLGGQLSVEFRTVSADPRTGVEPPASVVFALCAVVLDGERDLVGSLFGLGSGELPLA